MRFWRRSINAGVSVVRGNQRAQFVDIGGLNQMGIETCIDGLLPIFILAVSGQCNQ
jgi:hypothetical protein